MNINKLSEYNIPVSSVFTALKRDSYTLPAGNVVSGNTAFNVNSGDTYESVEEIANTVIHVANQQIIRLKDIADISKDYEEEKAYRPAERYKGCSRYSILKKQDIIFLR